MGLEGRFGRAMLCAQEGIGALPCWGKVAQNQGWELVGTRGLIWYPKLCWDVCGEAAQRDTLEVGAPTCLDQPCPSNLYLNT